jgi:hypothetical protein
MAFAHTPLSPAELGPAVVKMAGPDAPAQMRTMVARGMAPLPPRDLVVALYAFWLDPTDELSETAGKTVEGLPPAVIGGALDDKRLPAGAIDFLARKLARKEDLLEKVVRHPNVDNETLAGVAKVCPEGICDIIAENQTRWLEHPAIVVGLYNNRFCRMSVIHRVLELAVREGVEIKLPMMEEIKAVLETSEADPERDAMFANTLAAGEEVEKQAEQELERMEQAGVEDDLDLPLPDEDDVDLEEAERLAEEIAEGQGEGDDGEDDGEEEVADEGIAVSRERRLQTLMKMKPMEKIRAALLGDAYDRGVLVRDSNKMVAMATIKSPKVKENEAVIFSANRSLSHEVIRYIANRRDWVKLYTVKLNLVMNPKTPMARSMSLLAFLNGNDIKKVSRSKSIPSALAKAAKRKAQSRR